MVLKRLAAACAATFMLFVCCACDSGTEGSAPDGGDGEGDNVLSAFASLPEVRFSSMYAVEESGSCKFKMRSPFDDTFTVSFSKKVVEKVVLYDEEGKVLADKGENFDITLKEGQLVYADVKPVATNVRVTVTAHENKALMPFELGDAPDPASFKTTSDDPSDPLKPASINYVKRKDTLYVYCNAPEALSEKPEVINHCITRQSVSNQKVYFTMEQQSDTIRPGVFYGYRVRNTGKEDLYITVRNIGFQLAGSGSYLGEQEWTNFYNTKFLIPDLSDLTSEQMRNWKAYFNFDGKYVVPYFQPTTYRIPVGKFMYVFGGTTEDAFGEFNVGGTADQRVDGNCQNGAVRFDVIGEAEGAYYVYNDSKLVAPGTPGGDDHLGIWDAAYHVVHTGEDEGYVVDNSATWTFNDATPSQKLPVSFTNYYADDAPQFGTPGAKVEGITPHLQEGTEWITNINVQREHDGVVGTDMTEFHTVGPDGQRVTVGCDYYDTAGELANLGNWMKDYQDVFTFVNQGDKERTITANINCNGALVTLVRSMDGKVVPGTELFAFQRGKDATYGDAFDKAFHYTVKIPPHTVVQFVVEFNLMANSNGYVRHSVDLI